MAHIQIDKREFESLLGEKVSEERLSEDASMLGAHWEHVEGPKWDVEVYPDRPDLLSVEGLARAYRGFFLEQDPEQYDAEEPRIELSKDSSVEEVRPCIGGAVVKGVRLSEKIINGLIQLQEKLHETSGRRREKIAIGLHDMTELEPPFTYRAVRPEQVEFTPLEREEEMHLGRILDEHEKGQEYGWILDEHDKYPVIEDSAGQVLSFPPIINNQLTEVSPQTTDLFVDVTGTSQEAVHRALCIMSLALVERGGDLEQVEVDGRPAPNLSPEKHELDPDYLRQVSGLELSTQEIKERLEMMCLRPQETDDGGLEVEVPCYRGDVLHQYDLIEDVVIAHGYDNAEASEPDIHQHGDEKPVEEFSRVLRDIMVSSGALEAHTHILSSEEKQFGSLERPDSGAVRMRNPLTEDYSIVRKDLLPELLRALHDNRDSRFPQRFFEVDDVAELDDSVTGASNSRRLAYVVSGEDMDYTDARRVLHVLERDLGVYLDLREAEMPFHVDGRSAQILVDGERAGNVGQMSEQVLENWELNRPVAGFELEVEVLEESFRC